MADDRTYTKQELTALLQDEFARWEKLLSGLSEQRLTARDLPGGLSVKDVIAHLWAWQGLSVARLEAALDNRDPEYQLGPAGLDLDSDENVDRINAWIHEANLDRPWKEVYGDWRSRYQRFLALASKLPEEALMQPARYAWLKDMPLSAVLRGSYLHHHEEHYLPLIDALAEGGTPISDS